jgi:hypothetical protein
MLIFIDIFIKKKCVSFGKQIIFNKFIIKRNLEGSIPSDIIDLKSKVS